MQSQFRLLLQLFTATKQIIAKAWRSPSLVVVETKYRMNKALIHAKMEAFRNKLCKFERPLDKALLTSGFWWLCTNALVTPSIVPLGISESGIAFPLWKLSCTLTLLLALFSLLYFFWAICRFTCTHPILSMTFAFSSLSTLPFYLLPFLVFMQGFLLSPYAIDCISFIGSCRGCKT